MSSTARLPTEYSVKLTPVTPVHVWAGVNAVIDVSAFVRGDSLYVLTDRDLDQLSAAELEAIRVARRPEEAMRQAFEALLSRGTVKPLAKVRTTVRPKAEVRLLHENLVPGSTLKGYIRTALIRHLLSSMRPDQLASVIRSGVDLYGKRGPAHVSEGLEASVLRKPRLRKQGGFVDAMELLLVSDPEVIDRRLSLRKLLVAHRHDPRDVVAEVLAVVLDPTEREALRYSVKVLTPSLSAERVLPAPHEEHREIPAEALELKKAFEERLSRRDFLLDALRTHGCVLVKTELEKVRGLLADYYRGLLEELWTSMCEKRVDCVPARIGFMTGHEAKTVIDLVAKYAPDMYRDVVGFMQRQVGRVWDALTLKLVEYDGKTLGVGWCKLCVE